MIDTQTLRKGLTGDEVHYLKLYLNRVAEVYEASAAETTKMHTGHRFEDYDRGLARGFRIALEEIERAQAEGGGT